MLRVRDPVRVRDPGARSQFTQSVSKCFLIHLIDNASCYVGSLLDFTVVQHEQVSYDGSAAVKTHGHVSIMMGDSIHIKRIS